ncbi:MAG: prepilin peptidase, partial [Pirellulaceae bacterium]|nr:prepilin peptidase [Pirellulaceae bacterium]
MISQSSPAKFPRTQLGLWDEYAHHAIVIHAGSSLAWWTFSLANHPTSSIAWLCCLASGWLLVRQCTRLTDGHLWCMLISFMLVSLLGWQGLSPQTTPAAHWETIFAWWVLALLVVGCEVIVFLERRQRAQLQVSQLNMESPAEDDLPRLPLAASANPEFVAQGITTHTHTEEASQASLGNSLTKAPRSNWGMKWALLLIVSLLFVYMVVVPSVGYIIEQMTPPKTGLVAEDMSFAEKMRLHSVSGVVVLMFLALGGTIGSFLNVFIYRVPRGKPLLWPPSSCASCGTRIHGRDNVPVLGWFLINGRCRACAQPISARYPIIEAVVATVFIALYYVELLSGGDNLPVRSPNLYRGIVWILLYTKWDLVGLYTFHCLMLCLLLSVAMMNVDGFRLP